MHPLPYAHQKTQDSQKLKKVRIDTYNISRPVTLNCITLVTHYKINIYTTIIFISYILIICPCNDQQFIGCNLKTNELMLYIPM